MVWIEWGRNDTSPTLIALDTSHYPIGNIDFPAVTLCGVNRIKKSRALTLSNEWYVRIIIFFSHVIRMSEFCKPDAMKSYTM
jgi:hypothetical protein